MKIRQTRNQLIYTTPGFLEQMILRWNQHFERYGRYPSVVFLSKEDFELYYLLVIGNNQLLSGNDLYFRGAKVLLKK